MITVILYIAFFTVKRWHCYTYVNVKLNDLKFKLGLSFTCSNINAKELCINTLIKFGYIDNFKALLELYATFIKVKSKRRLSHLLKRSCINQPIGDRNNKMRENVSSR